MNVLTRILILSSLLSGLCCAQRGGSSGYGNTPQPADDAEAKILAVAEQTERHLNVPLEDGRLIRIFTESIGAKAALEIGTSTGYSGLWFALALRKTGGKLTTLEYDKGRAETARKNFRAAGVDSMITVIEGDAHETVTRVKGPFDIVFIDADKPGYADYLKKVLPLVRPGGIILAHNISRREQNAEYMDLVLSNPNLETMKVNAEMAVTLKKR